MQKQNKSSSKVLKLIVLSLLGTISFLLFYLNFPIPPLPGFLKVDFGEVPAIIAALIFSPAAGIVVIAIKNFLYFVLGGGNIVGVVSNFAAATMFIMPVAILYHKYRGTKSIIYGLIIGTIIMAIGMSILNYIIILPVYVLFMGMEEMSTESAKRIAVIYGVLPFNLLKGVIVGLLFVPLFVKMRNWIEQKQATIL